MIIARAQKIILGGNGKLSMDTITLLKQYPINPIGVEAYQQSTYELSDVDAKYPFVIDSIFNNGDIGVGPEEFYGIIKDHKEKNNLRVSINYIFDSTVISSSNPDTSTYYPKMFNEINCNYIIGNVSLNLMNDVPIVMTYKKTIQYLHFTLALNYNKLYLVVANELKPLSIFEVNDPYESSYLDGETIDDFWVIKQPFNPVNYLYVSSNNYVILFEIQITNGIFLIDHHRKIQKSKLNVGSMTIYACGLLPDDNYAFGTSQGIIFAKITKDNAISSITQYYNDIVFSDFIVLSYSLYALGKNSGVYIFALKESSNSILLPHTRGSKLDFVQNPFTSNYFIGMHLNPLDNSDEFFIEFYIPSYDELNPKVNKVFCIEGSVTSSATPDTFNSYFLHKDTVHVIRRGMFNKIPSLSLVLKPIIPHNYINSLTEYYNETTGTNRAAVVSNGRLYPLNHTNATHEFTCTTSHRGNYYLIFQRNTDACASNIGSKNRICAKLNYYHFQSHSKEMSTAILIAIIVPCVVAFLVIIGVVYYCARYNFFYNRLTLLQLDKKNRADIYQDNTVKDDIRDNVRKDTDAGIETPLEKKDIINPSTQITDESNRVTTGVRFISSRQSTNIPGKVIEIIAPVRIDSKNVNESKKNLIHVYRQAAVNNNANNSIKIDINMNMNMNSNQTDREEEKVSN